MKMPILIAKVVKFLRKHTIEGIVPTLEEIIESEISKINCPKVKQNYISRVVIDLYNDGELETAFYISNKYRHDN